MEVPEERKEAPAQTPREMDSSKKSSLHLAGLTQASDGEKAGPGGVRKAEAEELQYPHGLALVMLASAAMTAIFLIALDQTIVGTAIPKITAEFNGIADVSWYAAAYFMTFGAAHSSAGKMYRHFDIKWSFLLSMFVFEFGSLLCGVAPNSATLIVGRAIAGFGGAGLSVGGTSIVALAAPPPKRPFMMGLIATTYSISAVLGPLLGGAFTEGVSWRWCFYINLPIGGAAALALFFFFHLPAAAAPPEIPLSQKLLHLDPVGLSLAMGAIVSLILALQYGGATHAWNSSLVIGLLVGFAAICGALAGWEIWLGDYAMLTPRLYRRRFLWSTAPMQFFFMGSFVLMLYYMPIYFQSILNTTPIQSGINNLPYVIAAAVFALAGGVFVTATGRAQQVMFGGSALSTVALGLIYTLGIGSTTAQWAGYQVFAAACTAFALMHGQTVVQANVGPKDLPAAMSNLLFFQALGGALSTSAGQAAFVNQLLANLPRTAPTVNPALLLVTGASDLRKVFPPEVLPGVLEAYMIGIKAAFAVGIGFCGAAALLSLFVPWRKLPTHTAGDAPMMMA